MIIPSSWTCSTGREPYPLDGTIAVAPQTVPHWSQYRGVKRRKEGLPLSPSLGCVDQPQREGSLEPKIEMVHLHVPDRFRMEKEVPPSQISLGPSSEEQEAG